MYKVCTDQQEDNLGELKVIHYLRFPFRPGSYISIIPGRDDILSFEITQVYFEFFAKCLILMGVRDKDLNCHDILLA